MIYYFLFLLSLTIVHGSMHIYSPSDLEGDYLSIGYYLNGKQGDWMINGSLVEMDEKYGCDVNTPNLMGKIAAVTKEGKRKRKNM